MKNLSTTDLWLPPSGVFEWRILHDGNMALLINSAQILYYHMNAVRLNLLGYSYFSSPDYLTVKAFRLCSSFLNVIVLTW